MATTLALKSARQLGDFALDVELTTELPAVTAIMGASGAGKTTLLNIVAGFRRAQGRVRLADEFWESDELFVPAWQRPVGTVFQHSALFSHLDVRGNLRFAERRQATDGPVIDRQKIIEVLGIQPLLDRHVAALSGGERRRVAIARALLNRPRLLLLDEPLAGLDSRAAMEVLPLIREIAVDLSVPVVYVTHDVHEVIQIADDVIVMDAGRVINQGSLSEVYTTLAESTLHPDQAGAILDGKAERIDGDMVEVTIGQQQLLCRCLSTIAVGDPVRIRLRARDLIVAGVAPERISVRNKMAARLVKEQPTQSGSWRLTFAIADQEINAELTESARTELGLQPGDPAFVLIKAINAEAHWFRS